MTARDTKARGGSTSLRERDSGLREANRVAKEIRARWQRGEPPDTAAVVAAHPELCVYRSVVLDLAHEEYRLRRQAGQDLDPEEFARRLPDFQQSLCMLIAVRSLLENDPDWRALIGTSAWPQPGEEFLGRTLLAELGRGTFGRVFLAAEPALGGRQVAMKVAPRGGHEAEILGRLQHPNIVPVYSVQDDEATNLTAFCMPFLGRATLGDVLDIAFANGTPPHSGRIILAAVENANADLDGHPAARADRILRNGCYVEAIVHLSAQLANALQHAHAQGIYHRDLKPSNVLLSPEGTPLLLDFNLSADKRWLEWKAGGTLPYMAPEELARLLPDTGGGSAPLDPRSDLFSLGVIAYQLLTGRLPFDVPTDCGTIVEAARDLRERQTGEPIPIRRWNRRVDRRLARLLESCLAPDPVCRPKSARDLAAALRKELSLGRRLRRWVDHHPRKAIAAATVSLAIAAGGVFTLATRPPYAVRQFQLATTYADRRQYEPAIACLNEVLRVEPENEQALLARAQVRLRTKDFNLGFEDFRTLARQFRRPEFFAAKGYCFNRLGQHTAAIATYRQALELGCESPAVLNNLGFSCLQLGRLDEAANWLKQAIAKDENLQPSYHNLLIVYQNRGHLGQGVPQEAFSYADAAVRCGPPSARLFRDIAVLYSVASSKDPARRQAAVGYMTKAVACGADPNELAADPVFSPLRDEPSFHAIFDPPANLDRPSKSSQTADLLVEPKTGR